MNKKCKFQSSIYTPAILMICFFWSAPISSQNGKEARLHTPAEILKIMEESKLIYEIDTDTVTMPVDSPIVLSNQMYLCEYDSGYSLETLSLSDQCLPIYNRAEEAFQARDFSTAVTLYKQILTLQPEYFYGVPGMARTLGSESLLRAR